MYTIKNGKDCFVLNDFDLAIHLDKTGLPQDASTDKGTGTLPFMAVELLDEMHKGEIEEKNRLASRQWSVRHCVRFDFQSLLWVSVWCAVKLPAKGISARDAKMREDCLSRWERGTFENMANRKGFLLRNTIEFVGLPLSPLFKHLERWFLAFRQPFAEACRVEDEFATEDVGDTEFEEFEDGHGEVTLEKFRESFKSYERRGDWRAKRRRT